MVYLHPTGFSYKKYAKTYHLVADSVKELHEFAEKIGLKRCWFQSRSTPHYDVFGSVFTKAIEYGAKLINNKEMYNLIKNVKTSEIS